MPALLVQLETVAPRLAPAWSGPACLLANSPRAPLSIDASSLGAPAAILRDAGTVGPLNVLAVTDISVGCWVYFLGVSRCRYYTFVLQLLAVL